MVRLTFRWAFLFTTYFYSDGCMRKALQLILDSLNQAGIQSMVFPALDRVGVMLVWR